LSTQLSFFLHVSIAGATVPLSDKITTLGVTLDSCLTSHDHISTMCRSGYFHVRALCHIWGALTDERAKVVVVSVVQWHLNYADSIFVGLPVSKDFRLCSFLAHVVVVGRPYLSSTSLLQELHWLPIHSRITFKLASLTYKTLEGHPSYLRSPLQCYTPSRTLCSAEQYLLEQPYPCHTYAWAWIIRLGPFTFRSGPFYCVNFEAWLCQPAAWAIWPDPSRSHGSGPCCNYYGSVHCICFASRLWIELSQALCVQNSKQLQLHSSQVHVTRKRRLDAVVQCRRNCGLLIVCISQLCSYILKSVFTHYRMRYF